ncbi:MAG: hypothetical protein L6Q29_02845 [Candidatus Pacebacteria bacterium]|nr:hypothetical protein [Candidatus Paceibacterota bacterium]
MNLARAKKFAIIFFLMLSFVISQNSFAQEINDYSSEFSIETIPGEPKPGERVSAKIVSYQFDPNRSDITWTLDGKIITRGMGVKTADFVLPSLGKESVLKVDIIANNGAKTSKTRKFSGSDIDFLWEAQTTVPAGYKGKALAGRGTVVKITALPHLFSAGSILPRNNLVYEWSLNYKNLPDSSGASKNTLAIRLNDLGDYVVGLKVSTQNKSSSFQKYLHLTAEGIAPKVSLYRDDPLEGPLYGKSLAREMELSGGEISLRAEPYFFNIESGASVFNWFMNGKAIKPAKKPNVVSLRAESGSGEATIKVVARKETPKSFQEAERVMNITF